MSRLQLNTVASLRAGWSHSLFWLNHFGWVVGEAPHQRLWGNFLTAWLTLGDFFVSLSEGHTSKEKAKLFRILGAVFSGWDERWIREETANKDEKLLGKKERHVWQGVVFTVRPGCDFSSGNFTKDFSRICISSQGIVGTGFLLWDACFRLRWQWSDSRVLCGLSQLASTFK